MEIGPAVIVLCALALIPAALAYRRGRSPILWGLAGVVAWFPTFALLLVLRDERRVCPSCARRVAGDAVACGRCDADIAADAERWRARPRERLHALEALAVIAASLVGLAVLLTVLAELG